MPRPTLAPPTTTSPTLGPTSRELARLVLVHGPISRAELGRRLDLSPASLTRLSKPFLERGLFVESAAEHGLTGRPTRPLDVRVDAARFAGVKVTGDAAFGVVTDLRSTPLASAERALPGHAPEEVVRLVAQLVRELVAVSDGASDAPLTGLGVSVGGNVEGGRVVTRAPFLGWRDVLLADLLEGETGLPTTVENDVTALTTAEQWFGPARDVSSFAVVTIGAGVGYGLVVADRVIVTPDTGLGLGGHVPLDPDGPRCPDGHPGCSTAMLAAPSIAASAGAALGREITYDEVLRLAAAGDPAATAVTEASGRALGRLLGHIANLALVDTIVLSGEGIGLWDVVGDVARERLDADRDPEATPVTLHVDDSGFVAWARGAAATAIQAAVHTLRLPGT
ncbi:ROK family transcriptional regulator [Isoptericola variabilis]|uniref:ROK family protein n=1 Tax=Isoptericola variabilis (strain 225) TaxID=743718 RepID=F6FS40_ISOV2|nr:ROK family transcriptional regulator [Isoptericola variabilis]AEG45137.1 ROK family protein [Isoptericola variabilis 225]TWH31429.1 putative NBD/HSP70 family sugar kinase [Isoptericola variabilis J7]